MRRKKQLSHQAVHKALRELISNAVVDKIDKNYLLRREWVKEQTRSFSRFYTNYFKISYNPNQIDEKSRIQVFRFNSLKEVIDFIIEAYVKGFLNKEGDDKIYISLRRLHPLIPQSLIQAVKRFSKDNEICVLCKGDSFADRWTARLAGSLGIKVKTGVGIPHQNTICFNDCILQYFLFFDQAYKDRIHAFSDMFKKKTKLQLLKLTTEMFYKKAEMYIVINRYPVFVNDVKESVEKEFI